MKPVDPTFWNTQVELIKAMGPPVRPHASEILIMQSLLRDRMAARPAGGRIRVLVLGVTPEIVGMDWPHGTELTAVDQSESMIAAFWPGDIPGQRTLVRADWLHMPFEPGSFHFVLGDNVFNALDYPQGFRNLAERLGAVTRPEGLLIVRVLCQAEPIEHGRDIVAEYRAGQLTDYHQFRFRMMTADQASVEEGLFTSKEAIDKSMEAHGLDMAEVYETTGYRLPRPPAAGPAPPMKPYKVSYPTPDEFLAAVSHRFELVDTRHGGHALAHRTPVFALEPRG